MQGGILPFLGLRLAPFPSGMHRVRRGLHLSLTSLAPPLPTWVNGREEGWRHTQPCLHNDPLVSGRCAIFHSLASGSYSDAPKHAARRVSMHRCSGSTRSCPRLQQCHMLHLIIW